MGTLTLEPDEIITEHWHPYSEEFLYCVSGDALITLDGAQRQTGRGIRSPYSDRAYVTAL